MELILPAKSTSGNKTLWGLRSAPVSYSVRTLENAEKLGNKKHFIGRRAPISSRKRGSLNVQDTQQLLGYDSFEHVV
jgi:hypothetical protein